MKKIGKQIITLLTSATLVATGFTLPAAAEEEAYTTEQYLENCFAGTAKNAASEEDLLKIADLYFNVVEPQAVNLLIEKIPAFKEAADRGELSRNIGAYLYYKEGDDNTEFELSGAATNQICKDENGRIANLLAYDIRYLFTADDDGKLRADLDTADAKVFANSVLHELMHAFMSDYNRTGMLGTGRPEMYRSTIDDEDEFLYMYDNEKKRMFPEWFIEGVACIIGGIGNGNELLLAGWSEDPEAGVHTFTKESVFMFYLTSYNYWLEVGTVQSSYCSSIPATLYLCELQAADSGRSSISEGEGGTKVFDSSVLLSGLNTILTRLHGGETLDAIIADISGGNFRDTADFAKRFIKGDDSLIPEDDPDFDIFSVMETASAQFCADLLNYLESLYVKYGHTVVASLLFDYDNPATCAIDMTERSTSGFYKPTLSGKVETSVVLPVPYTDGGKSAVGTDTPTYDELAETVKDQAEKEWAAFDTDALNLLGTEDAAKMIEDLYYPSNIIKAADFTLPRADHNSVVAYVNKHSRTANDTFLRNQYSFDDDFLYDDTAFSLILTRAEEVPATDTEPGVKAHFAGNDGKKYDLYKEVSDEDLIIPPLGSDTAGDEESETSLPTGDPDASGLLALCALSACAAIIVKKRSLRERPKFRVSGTNVS